MVSKLFITIVMIFVLISVAIVFVVSNPAFNQLDVSGLKAGNVFKFSIKGFSEVNDENASASIPARFLELNMTEWYTVTVTSVSGPDVTFNTTWHFINGTENQNIGKVNVLTGVNNGILWAIYPKNLGLNDLVRPEGTDGAIVNQTESRNYPSGNRETNIMTMQQGFVDADDPTLSRSYDDYLYVHFDKAAGMLVELRDMKIYSDPQVILTLEWQLLDSNVWAVT
jgi:hypothetical protein